MTSFLPLRRNLYHEFWGDDFWTFLKLNRYRKTPFNFGFNRRASSVLIDERRYRPGIISFSITPPCGFYDVKI